MRDVYVLGIGQTKFGVFPEYTGADLGVMASVKAVKDAGISAKEIQVAYAGYCRGPSTQGQMAFTRMAVGSIPIANLNNACASGNTAAVRDRDRKKERRFIAGASIMSFTGNAGQ